MPRGCRMRVMIVVPALAGCQERNPPVISGIISGSKSAATPHVRSRIDQPSRVEADDYPEADAPKQEWNTADSEKEQCKDDHGNPMIVVQPHVKAIFRQIWRVFSNPLSIAAFALSNKKPADVSPQAAVTE